MRYYFLVLFNLFFSFIIPIDSLKIKAYVEKYKNLALEQELKFNIPATVILAQAIIESDAGCSTLAVISNNHFGIKSHKEWQGEFVYYHDDHLFEKFRKYDQISDSYEDHSMFLISRPRYKKLFSYTSKQWTEWCFGLQECGYATSPDYAVKLIETIEKYKLNSIYNAEPLTLKDCILPEYIMDLDLIQSKEEFSLVHPLSSNQEKLLTFASRKKAISSQTNYR
ncbi:MAG: glucosaminidase domain-containing protein [Bacteroidia bacterium]|nr:glucosaminidase domain-containing protein [Bacteroidia bacterium]